MIKIYYIFGEQNKTKVDSYFLLVERNGNASNLSISHTDKWTKNVKLDFLRALYLKK
jgi:hypothetical protein